MRKQVGTRSPSEHVGVSFLKRLQENNYISTTNVEYDKFEVDRMYNLKSTELGQKRAEKLFKDRMKANKLRDKKHNDWS